VIFRVYVNLPEGMIYTSIIYEVFNAILWFHETWLNAPKKVMEDLKPGTFQDAIFEESGLQQQ